MQIMHKLCRHFYEMFSTNDDQLADEHIRPARFISANTNLWFSPPLAMSLPKIQKIKLILGSRSEKKDSINWAIIGVIQSWRWEIFLSQD